jgi:hypothetical protein
MSVESPVTSQPLSRTNVAFDNAAQEVTKRIVKIQSAPEATNRIFKKSCAQVASSASPCGSSGVSPHGSPPVSPHSTAGLRPIPAKRTKRQSYGFKFKDGELEIIKEKAVAYRMDLNTYIRAKALGDDYIEKPPDWLRDVLLKVYVELVRQGNNLNQLTRSVNRDLVSADAALSIADEQRTPVFRLLEKVELALSGQRPPDDY